MSHVEMMEFPYGQFLEVRMEYVLLRDNELEAKIMRIIEGWMVEQKKVWLNKCAQAASDGKQEPPEPDYFVTLSYAQIMSQLYMFNSSRKGVDKEVVEGKKNSIHRNTITKAMAALIEDKYVITRPNPNKAKEYEATQYTLNLLLIQNHMRLLPKNPMSYLGSNGRIDGVPCPDFFNPPAEIPCTKFVHGSRDAQKKETPCTKNVHPTQEKSASPSTKNVQGDAQKSSHLIDRGKDKIIDSHKERKNGTSQQEVNVTTREESFHSFNQSSLSSQNFSSSQGTKRETKPEVIFSSEAEQIMECGKKLNLVALKWDENHKGYCDTLLEKGVTTFEQLESLMRYCEQLPQLANKVDKKICLKNLVVNALPGWLQAQQSIATTLPGIATSSYDDDDFVDDTFYGKKVINIGNHEINDASTEDDQDNNEDSAVDNDVNVTSTDIMLPSPSQRANVTAYLRMYMRKFLLEMGATGNLMDKHLTYLQEVYYASGLDKESFRYEAENAISQTRLIKGDMDYFYDCLCNTLEITIAEAY